jgi:hypothetical protein
MTFGTQTSLKDISTDGFPNTNVFVTDYIIWSTHMKRAYPISLNDVSPDGFSNTSVFVTFGTQTSLFASIKCYMMYYGGERSEPV